ncbi:MAG: NUDIX domain-containing protein [Bacteroidetes bacterium]|jgi:ADP-ribose pyrophosphatase YjhB (NUDIX family)|nr:NUDIX domain-containing protein [Bacteroidota bacterium]
MSHPQYKHQHQYLAVDCVIFGYENGQLKLLSAKRKFEPAMDQWSLMGGWVRMDETVEQAAIRVLFQITGLRDIYLEQVQVFSQPQRDPGGRVVSIVFYAMIPTDQHDKSLVHEHEAVWFNLPDKPKLIFDHDQMVEFAHEKLKQKASYELIGADLLPEKFTILQLRLLYEAVFQREFDPGNFRKKVLSLKVLERLNDKNTNESKKGAYYFRFITKTEALIKERIVKI